MATPLESWVNEAAALTKPDRLVYCDGSEAEYQRMTAEMLRGGDTEQLNEKTYPNCHLHRSSPNDVARTEHLTFICSRDKDDTGPTNNWMDPGAAKHKVGALLDGAMRGRTMYVVPYIMGPANSPIRIHASDFLKQIVISVPEIAMLAAIAYMPRTVEPVASVMRPSM